MSNVNWSDLIDQAGGSFDALPADIYDALTESCEATQSSTKKLMFKAVFRIQGGPYHNRKIWNNFTLSPENPNALTYFFKHMGALGFTRDFFAQNPPPASVAQAMVGRPCRLKLKQKTYRGELRNDVEDVLAPEGGAGAIPASPGGGPVPAAPPAPPAAPAPAPAPPPAAAPAPPSPPPVPTPPPAPAAPAPPAAPAVPEDQAAAFAAWQAEQAKAATPQPAPAPAAETPATPQAPPVPF